MGWEGTLGLQRGALAISSKWRPIAKRSCQTVLSDERGATLPQKVRQKFLRGLDPDPADSRVQALFLEDFAVYLDHKHLASRSYGLSPCTTRATYPQLCGKS